MRNTLNITFKEIKHTPHLVEFIENKFQRVKKKNAKIIQCNVVIKAPHNSHKTGNCSQVSITAKMPGKDFVIKRFTSPQKGTDLYSAISDGFRTLENQVKLKPKKRLSIQDFKQLSYLLETHP